ncbi:MAG: heparan-alpha-glucosaminide N-acetyltransferase [Oscillospiraceae bacterium]
MYKKRIQLLDFARGIAVLLMLFYHFIFDLALFNVTSWEFMFSGPMNFLERIISWTFILVAGFSSKLSRDNLKRGAIVFACGICVSVASQFVGVTIRFGILQFLGCSMVLYGLLGHYLEKLPRFFGAIMFITLFIVTDYMYRNITVPIEWLYPLGLRSANFVSSDYFPLMPWFFLFLIGAWMASETLRSERRVWMDLSFPGWITWTGRRSLLIYLIHQPVLYPLAYVVSVIIA